ncbi:NUDIX hydrolase [Azospirillum sp.]|uniref:NUDIX hydrolase n=1 Tax=Azospirillum sp. TaxID=34012 RepID=UPI003D7204B9
MTDNTGPKDLKPWRVAASRDLLDASPFLKVRVESIELPDGRRIDDYYQLEMPSFACIFAETEDGRVITCRQYRHGPRRISLVFPGGHLNASEDPLEAAKRELLEETGYEGAEWQDLGAYMVNSNQGGPVSHMFRAIGCRKVAEPDADDLEESEVLFLTRAELMEAAGRGEFALLTQIALFAMVTNADLTRSLAAEAAE